MLSAIADKIWGNTVTLDLCSSNTEDYVSPSKSTDAGDDVETVKADSPELSKYCSLWKVDGQDAVEVMDMAEVKFDKKHFVLKGREVRFDSNRQRVTVEGEDVGKMELKFSYDCVVQFRQCNEDIYQWMMTSSSGNAITDEYGLLFGSIDNGGQFTADIYKHMIGCSERVLEASCQFKEYIRKSSCWIDLNNDCKVRIYERKKDRECYMTVTDTAAETVLSQLTLSHEDYIYPQPSENRLTWWGPDVASAQGHRKMFAVEFANPAKNKDLIESIFAFVTNLMNKRPCIDLPMDDEGGKDEGGSRTNDDFDMKMGASVGAIELLADDKEDVEMEVKSRDTSRDKILENPNRLLHRMMYVGSKRTFVVRAANHYGGSLPADQKSAVEMQVFKFDNNKEEVVATIDGDKLKYKDNSLCPTKGLLHDNEAKMLLVDQTDKENVYDIDVEKQTVVAKYGANNNAVHHLMEKAKGSSLTGEKTFLCSNNKNVFTVDTRAGCASGPAISYVTNVQFTTGDVDREGHILMGSKMGDMRLYDGGANKDGKLKKAKTHLPGLGEPLLDVCVSKDGHWILGTCNKYLVLFPVKLNGTSKTGFVSCLGKAKPNPIILKLSMDDVHTIVDVNFTRARFNHNQTAIVTSTGNLAVIWDMQKVVGGNTGSDSYVIKKMDDYIKDISFIENPEGSVESVVVATPCGLTTAPVIKA